MNGRVANDKDGDRLRVCANFEEQELTIGQVKVDRDHQGKGLGGLLLEAAEKSARGLGCPLSTVNMSVLQTNQKAQRCYAKAGFKVYASGPSRFPPCSCRDGECQHAKINWKNASVDGIMS